VRVGDGSNTHGNPKVPPNPSTQLLRSTQHTIAALIISTTGKTRKKSDAIPITGGQRGALPDVSP
jgi:hypothetical protein